MKYYLNSSYEFLTGDSDCADNALCPQKLHLDITQDCNLYCKMCRSDCVVEISTNGMLLSDEMTDFLYQENVSIIISVDSADKKTFDGIRRGSDFERIMCNAKNAAAKYCDFSIQYAPKQDEKLCRELEQAYLYIKQNGMFIFAVILASV